MELIIPSPAAASVGPSSQAAALRLADNVNKFKLD